MATKKRPAPKPRTKGKPKTKTAAKPKRASASMAAVPAPMPLVEPVGPPRGVWLFVAVIALLALFLGRAAFQHVPAPAAPAPQPMPAAAPTPEGRSAAPAPILPPAPKPEVKTSAGSLHRANAGAPAAEADGASSTFDRSQGSLALRCWRTEGGQATLEVFGPRNLRVRSLHSDSGAAGWKVLRWDGKDEQGAKVPTGMYFLRLSSADGQEVRDVWVKG